MSAALDPSLFPFDAVPWRGAFGLVRAAIRRHWFQAVFITVVFVAVAATAAKLLPRTYSTELRMLSRRGTSVMSALADPRRAVAPGFDQPSQGAVEIGLSRSALTTIVHEGGLGAHWKKTRPTLMRWKDMVRERISGPMSPDELDDAMVSLLESRLHIRVQDDVILIKVSWWDPAGVQLILTEAQQAFVAERTRYDIKSIEDTYAILRQASAAMTTQMNGNVSAFQMARSKALGDQAAKIPVKATTATLSQLRDQLLERRAYREELERRSRMKRADLRVQLAQQAATLGPRHPDRINTEQALARLDGEDDGLPTARSEEEAALKSYTARGGSLDILDANTSQENAGDPASARPDDDPTVIAARAHLRMSADGLQDLMMRTENARIELETARAAIPYKYVVTRPADRPRKPDAPNVGLLLIGGFMSGTMAGVLSGLRRYLVAETARTGLGLMDLVKLTGTVATVGAVEPAGAVA